jgi:glycosyltransferase involved in cell wall biosynthesis
MPRVAIISPTFGGYGGMEAFALAIARGLPPTADLEVRLVFKRTQGFTLRSELSEAVAPLGGRVSFVDRGSAALRAAIAWADLVHAMNPSPDVVLGAKLRRRRVLINVINHRVPGKSLRQRLWDFCLRRGDRRFYISDFVRRSWEGASPWRRSDVVFPICELAKGVLPPEQRRGFVFAARWVGNKGLDTLVNAYAEAALDPTVWPLVLVGDGPLREMIERSVAEGALRGVAMPGFVTQEKKAELIRSARWMVVPPNTNEDFGLTAIEARHLGVPCIITRDGGVPEAAGQEALTCAPGDVAGLAACLRQAAKMSDEEYAARAKRTRETLLPQLAGPEFYARAYRELIHAMKVLPLSPLNVRAK